MIIAIMGFNTKLDSDIQPILLDLRAYALQCPGFISAENLVASRNGSLFIFMTSWDSLASWNLYQKSSVTQRLIQKIQSLSLEEQKVTVYRPLPTTSWR